MKKLCLVALSAFSVLIVTAGRVQAATSETDIALAVDKVVSIFQPHMTPLDRATMTFHYGTTSVEPQSISHAVIADWAGSMAEPFYDVNVVTGDMQGAGFYVATDPQSTRFFGSTNPLLFAIPIKQGAMILDLISSFDSDDADLAQIQALATEFQCAGSVEHSEILSIESFTDRFRNSKVLACREIIVRAFRRLNVEAILYSYNSSSYAMGCRYRSDAFNIVSANAIGVDDNGLFWETGSFASKTLTRLISQSYRDAQIDFSTRYSYLFGTSKYEILGSLKNLSTFERSAQAWRKRNMLRCGPRWSVEGREPKISLVIKSLRTTFTDLEVQDAILDWQIAYRSKFAKTDYDAGAYQRISAVEKMIYLQTGLAKDFSQFDVWQQATDIYSNYNHSDVERDAIAGRLLGEIVPSVSEVELIRMAKIQIDSIYDSTHPQPGLYGDLLKRVGFGPLLIRLKLTQTLGFFGGVPILATAMPTDASTDAAADLAKNKTEFMKIVRPCIEMMKDPTISVETIQASECAIREIKRNQQ